MCGNSPLEPRSKAVRQTFTLFPERIMHFPAPSPVRKPSSAVSSSTVSSSAGPTSAGPSIAARSATASGRGLSAYRKRWAAALLVLSVGGAALGGSCKRSDTRPPEAPTTPTVRIYVASTIAGALEPCGCRKDMLGGVDHAAALVAKGRQEVPGSLVLAAGPTLFMNPELSEERQAQDTWKAEGIAEALSEMGLLAWSPGANDFAAGLPTLASLAGKTQAKILAANLSSPGVPIASSHSVEVNGQRVGITGVSLPKSPLGLPPQVTVGDLSEALKKGLAELDKEKAAIKVALVSTERGEALRLAERVPGFHVMIVGKSVDRGENNDPPTAPVMIGETLVVEAPNHLQGLGVVDLYVRDEKIVFQDAAGLVQAEERQSLERRDNELSRRIVEWETSGMDPKDIEARKADLAKLRARLVELQAPKPPATGSFFRYALSEVREGLGSDAKVEARMSDYYRRVNDHNKELFKDRKPPQAAAGQATYVGTQECAECHEEAFAFWETTGHAKAYKTLSDDFKEFNLDCVSCHVTGYERPGGSTVTFVENLKDVQCEECHGPGSLHAKSEDTDQITLRPAQDLCQKCHHPPHVADDWSAAEAWSHIVGKGHGENSKW
jgi:hypothetical protein